MDLAAEWAGFTTIAQVEIDPYCRRVLEKHWPGVHRVADIRDFPDEWYWQNVADAKSARCETWQSDGIRTEDSRLRKTASSCGDCDANGKDGTDRFRAVTLISGGFPCQPFSTAGKRRGRADNRHLWPEMFRVIRTVKPRWMLAENVPGLLAIESGMAFEAVLADLEVTGYETWAGIIPAAGVGTPHFRYRVFVVAKSISPGTGNQCGQDRGSDRPSVLRQGDGTTGTSRTDATSADVAHTPSQRWQGRNQPGWEQSAKTGRFFPTRPSADVADAGQQQRQEIRSESTKDKQGANIHNQRCGTDVAESIRKGLEKRDGSKSRRSCPAVIFSDWWSTEPNVGRVAHGIPSRVDRLRTLGNAVIPQQVYPILQAIAEVERSEI